MRTGIAPRWWGHDILRCYLAADDLRGFSSALVRASRTLDRHWELEEDGWWMEILPRGSAQPPTRFDAPIPAPIPTGLRRSRVPVGRHESRKWAGLPPRLNWPKFRGRTGGL